MSTCRQCGKTWASGTALRPPLVNGLCLACRRMVEAANWCEHCGRSVRSDAPVVHRGLCPDCRASYRHGLALWLHDFFWDPRGAAATQRPQPRSYWGRMRVFLFWGVVVGAGLGLWVGTGTDVGGMAGSAVAVIFTTFGAGVGLLVGAIVVPDRADERRQRPREQRQPVLPDTRPPVEPRPYIAPPPARTNHPAKGMTRPGTSTLESTRKQPPHGSSRAAEKWPPPSRVRPHRKG